jgi:CRISPR system Cascade subunit CasA
MPDRPRYDLADEPCIPVRTGRHHENLGLRELFLRAHTIEDLALTIPAAVSALLRVLIAITARLTGLDNPDLTADQWTALRYARLQDPDGFPPDTVHDYLGAHVLDLFHPTRPFLQDPALAHQCEKRAGVNKLVFGRPAGNNLAWLSPHHDLAPVPVPCDEAFWHLLIQHYYGASGCCSARTVNGRSLAKAMAGPLRSTISFHPLGRTLYETLLLGLPKFTGDWQDTPDACPWEEAVPPDPCAPPPPVSWPGRLLAGRSQHAVLLVPTPDGRAVADAYLTWATDSQHDRLEATDPYLVIDTDPKVKDVKRRRKPRRADADRAVWRDLDALLLAGDEKSTVQRPQVFDTLNDLPSDVRAAVRVRACGFDQDGKTNNRIWYTALTPPIWTWSQDHDPVKARWIAECRAAAEETGTLLAAQAAQAWRETITPPRDGAPAGTGRGKVPKRVCSWTVQASAEYWPRAETTFWRLVDSDPTAPPRPAFAADAITALRTVTAPAIVQHRRAGAAIARAVSVLRKAS